MSGGRVRAITDAVIAASLIVFAAIAVVVVIPAEVQQPLTRFGTASNAMSPAALPTGICLAIAACAVAYLVRTLFRLKLGGEASDSDPAPMAVDWRLAAIVLLSAAYIGSFQRVAFTINTSLFLLACYLVLSDALRRISARELVIAALGALAFSFVVETIFERGFKVYLGT